MTKSENELSSEESALKLKPETIADLDAAMDATDIKGGQGALSRSHETCV